MKTKCTWCHAENEAERKICRPAGLPVAKKPPIRGLPRRNAALDCCEQRSSGFERSALRPEPLLRRGSRAAILAAVPKPAAAGVVPAPAGVPCRWRWGCCRWFLAAPPHARFLRFPKSELRIELVRGLWPVPGRVERGRQNFSIPHETTVSVPGWMPGKTVKTFGMSGRVSAMRNRGRFC